MKKWKNWKNQNNSNCAENMRKKKIAAIAVATGGAVATVGLGVLYGVQTGRIGGMSSSTEKLTKPYDTNQSVDLEDSIMADLSDTEREQFARSYTDFSLELLRKSMDSTEEGSNTMVSPLSVMMVLEMTRNGASGETLEQMNGVLYPGIKPEDGKKAVISLRAQMKESGNTRWYQEEENKCILANSIWLRNDGTMQPKEAFLQQMTQDYGADVYRAPFDDSTLLDINRWVEEKTDGQVQEVLDQISEGAWMYLVNAAVYEGQWEDTYKESNVRDAVFYNEDGTEADISMMYGKEWDYIYDEQAEGFRKPYRDGYSFVALLPEEGVTLDEYLEGMDGEKFLQTILAENDTMVETGIPKFEAETEIDMTDVLAGMGMTLAFDEEYADFSQMADVQDGANVCISKVLHKTHILVDETGTKAGAATVVEVNVGAAMETPEEPKRVILDRPFVYAIVEDETGIPVFIGTVKQM